MRRDHLIPTFALDKLLLSVVKNTYMQFIILTILSVQYNSVNYMNTYMQQISSASLDSFLCLSGQRSLWTVLLKSGSTILYKTYLETCIVGGRTSLQSRLKQVVPHKQVPDDGANKLESALILLTLD